MSATSTTPFRETAPETVGSPTRTPMLAVENVSKNFAGNPALHPVSLQIGRGEVVAIVGRSGSGKSTLLRLIAGLEASTGGRILVDGEPFGEGINPRARLMFQDAALLPWLSVLDNVLLATPRGPDRRQVARAALAHVGLAAREREWPLVLSGGQRQRVALARALASAAELVLFDEPLGALDALTRLEMQNLIERLWLESRFSAVLVTHDVEEAVALADRVLVMEGGHLTFETAIDLERPRARSHFAFIELKERVLSQVMQSR
ncbi:MAG TPA: ABC transporter ATP-binding protein [Chthoniobacterales bacterium]